MVKSTIVYTILYLLMVLIMVGMFYGCADEKIITLHGVPQTIEPYGWANKEDKIPGIRYQISPETVVWSIVFSETILIPVLLTGYELWEPVGVTSPKEAYQ